jgi:hypothetical protein
MSSKTDSPDLQQIDKIFLKDLSIGDRLFHYPPKGDADSSFRESPSAEYTLYTVIDLPTTDDIVLLRAFDEKEEKKNFSRSEILSGDWWYMPEAK